MVFDLFHFIAKYRHDVIDRLRVDRANALCAGQASRKVIKRMAYGFRDDAYFFLEIRAAFPGVGS